MALNCWRGARGVSRRWMSSGGAAGCSGGDSEATGLVLGLYNEIEESEGNNSVGASAVTYTKTAEAYDKRLEGKLTEILRTAGPLPKKGEVRIFYGLDKRFSAVAVVGMGSECVSYSEKEQMDEWKEAIRGAAASGCKALQDLHLRTIFVEAFGHAESAAEGSALAVWLFQELKDSRKQKTVPRLELYEDCDFTGWQIGLQKAAAQNLARQLCETPANLLTPIAFAQCAVEVLCKAGVNVEVKVRNWSKMMEMNAFLAAARGSCEPPIFLETSYYGCDPDTRPVVLVGKGTTFDSGGLCLKDREEMRHMRGDLAGAAAVVATCRAVSALQLPINVRGLVPLLENLPGACAMKPGDIVRAKNGKTILVETTDFDGRLALADALSYSAGFNPKFILDVGTVTEEMRDSLGSAATGVFTNNDRLYEQMRIAGIHTGDRVWRMPLWSLFRDAVSMGGPGGSADVGGGEGGSAGAPCSAAAFLREFIPPSVDWIHLDSYGVSRTDGTAAPYLRPGMTGRPTRTLVEFLAQLACRPSECAEPEAPAST